LGHERIQKQGKKGRERGQFQKKGGISYMETRRTSPRPGLTSDKKRGKGNRGTERGGIEAAKGTKGDISRPNTKKYSQRQEQ